MKVALAIAAVLAMAAPQLARAGDGKDQTGNDVLESCRRVSMLKKPRTDGDGLYMGQCMGMAQTLVSIGSHLQPSMRFCMPGEATYQQATKVFVAYMDAHPERLHEIPIILAIDAFKAAWPCKS